MTTVTKSYMMHISSDNERLLNKKILVKDVLNLLKGMSYNIEEDLLRKLKEIIKPPNRYHKPQKPHLTEYEINKRAKPLVNINELYPPIILDYKKHYLQRGYAVSTLDIHMRNLRQFTNFLNKSYDEQAPFSTLADMKKLTKPMIIAYENFLVERLNTEQIQRSSLYKYLVTLKLFLKMLSLESIIHIKYIVPDELRAQGKRSNEYVDSEQIKKLIETVSNSKSRLKIRDMCVILLTMELGCRPIETTNIQITDIRLTERQITLSCEKSGIRTLKISKDLCDVIKKYLQIRSFLKIPHPYLFVNIFGERLSRNGVSNVFERANIKAFGENRFSPKALRHTYATNALDNENDFDEVSASLGHKHRCSTEWYIHRSVKRMLNRTLSHNPLNRIISEE